MPPSVKTCACLENAVYVDRPVYPLTKDENPPNPMPPVAPSPELPNASKRAARVPTKAPPDLRLLRLTLWVYLLLWVFEGALRKWIVPSLANPLLVVRDPVLLALYAMSYAKGVFPRSAFIPWIVGLGAVATFTSMFFTPTPLVVTMFGLRADFMHLPLIFLLPELLSRADLKLIGKATLLIGLGMAALVLLQFRASAGSFLNAGAGENTTMLESAFGHVRPSGTFSYTNGLTGFTALMTAFFLQHLLEKRVYPRLIWLACIPALLVMIVLSGSRLAAGTIALILACVVFISLLQSRYRASSFKLVALIGVGVFLIGSFAVFQSGMDVFSNRFKSNKVEQSGFVGRYFSTVLLPFQVLDRAEWTGAGLGMGTNVAAGLLTGERKFTFAEGEGGRVILESGPAIGFAYLLLRLCIMIFLGLEAIRAVRTQAATLPLLLFSSCFNDILIGQFSQATELGYATIAGGLCLAASRTAGEPASARETEKASAKEQVVRLSVPPPKAVVQGRSAYAARLHHPPTDPQA